MKKINLADAFAPLPDDIRAQTRATLRALDDNRARKPRLSFALAVAAGLLLLTGIAYAMIRWGAGEYLMFTRETPPPAVQDAAIVLNESAESRSVRALVSGAAYDGRKFVLSWVLENTAPEVPVLMDVAQLTINGEPVYVHFSSLPGLIPADPAGMEAGAALNPLQGGLVAYPEAAYTGWVDIEVTFSISDAGNGIEPDPARRTLLDTVAVSFKLDAGKARRFAVDATPAAPFLLEDCAFHIDSLVLSPIGVTMAYRFVPKENTLAAAAALGDVYFLFDLLDNSGQPIAMGEMEGDGGAGPQDMGGQWVYSGELLLGGVRAMPDEINVKVRSAPWIDETGAILRLRKAFEETVVIPVPRKEDTP